MNKLFIILSLFSGVASATDITLSPGSNIIVNAGSTMTVSCSGQKSDRYCTCDSNGNGGYTIELRQPGSREQISPALSFMDCVNTLNVMPACH